jgi:aldose 1-epimerase
MRKYGPYLILAVTLPLLGVSTSMGKLSKMTRSTQPQNDAASKAPAITIGGEPVVTLTRPRTANSDKPQFLGATLLPGEGMNLLQVKAFIPGKGEVDLFSAPSLPESKELFEKGNDEFGNESFKIGGAFLVPYVNRIRGKLSADGKTIETPIAGKEISLPANWKGKNPGAELHAMHGLILSAKFQDVKSMNAATESTASAIFHGGNFGGHWLSKTDVSIRAVLKDDALDLMVTAKNVGDEVLPVAITLHPYFRFPSGDRKQARLHLTGDQRVVVTNYDDVFPTGEIVPVKGTPYDFTAPGGVALGSLFMDDCFTNLKRGKDGDATIEITDPAAHYGMRILAISPQIKSIQIYTPPDKDFIAVEPQFNLGDPYNTKIWGKRDTGMVSVQPGQSVTWHIRLELFTPGK